MAYEATRHDDPETEKERNDANNANNVRNAADVAIASGNPYAMGAGFALKGIDKVTGGKGSEIVGKAVSNASKITPGGKKLQDLSNDLSESGVSDQVGKVASVYNKTQNVESVPGNKENPKNKDGSGGEQDGSLPSSREEKKEQKENRKESSEEAYQEEEKKNTRFAKFVALGVVRIALFILGPFFLVFLLFLIVIGSITVGFTNYEDAFGISQTLGEETGNYNFKAATKDQQAFYDRVNDVKLTYQAQDKEFDALKIVAIYHVLKSNGANIDYDDMTTGVIQKFADSMLVDGVYSEETFQNNLMQTIIPKYLSKSTDGQKKRMVQEILDYSENYYDLIGAQGSTNSSLCEPNNCTYDIKGYAIRGKGNVVENIQVSNLKVRLMQCGTASGHNYGGTFGQPLEGEDLIPFEKYILGVTYQMIGEDAPEEAIKAQMVAARSYILARHADLEGWRTLQKEEDGTWVLQVAACSQDQVYCDPDKGCSGTSGQWGQVYSGLNHDNGFRKSPLSSTSNLRAYSSQTSGEVVVNDQGYIVYTGYQQAEQNKFISYANEGLKYKQILLQVYNQGDRQYGASDVTRASCKADESFCGVSSGEFASWKQYSGPWTNVQIGTSGRTIQQIGCLATSVAILIAKSGVPTNVANFNPGTFVDYLNSRGGFSGGNFIWASVSQIAPRFQFQGRVYVSGMSRQEKLNKIKELVNQKNIYVVAEVKGNTGQHWVAIDSVNGDTINMMDPGSTSTNMWQEYPWGNTSTLAYFRVV